MNTKHNDGSEIAELMQCLLEPVVTNPKFPALAKELQAEKGNVRVQLINVNSEMKK